MEFLTISKVPFVLYLLKGMADKWALPLNNSNDYYWIITILYAKILTTFENLTRRGIVKLEICKLKLEFISIYPAFQLFASNLGWNNMALINFEKDLPMNWKMTYQRHIRGTSENLEELLWYCELSIELLEELRHRGNNKAEIVFKVFLHPYPASNGLLRH